MDCSVHEYDCADYEVVKKTGCLRCRGSFFCPRCTGSYQLAIIVSLLIVLSVVGLSFAKEKTHATKAMHVTGEVTAVDAAANTLTIKGKNGEVVLTTTDKTKFAEGKTLADVKVGDKLSAEYSEKDGKMMAWKVMTKEEMKKMKKEKEKD